METKLVDLMGTDLTVVNAARVSFGKKKEAEEDGAAEPPKEEEEKKGWW